MKKIILVLGLLVVAMFLVGCAEKELTKEEEQALESELEQLSDEELDKVIEEGESEDTKALAGQAYQRRSFGKYNYKPSRVLKAAYKVKARKAAECIWQDYAGGIKDCGIKSDGKGGTINCNYQKYAGGLECPPNYECINQDYAGGIKGQCVEKQCTPKECVYQAYAGGIKDCGIKDDGCGGTINCNYQAYAGGLECPSGYDCVYQDYAGGIKGECIAQ